MKGICFIEPLHHKVVDEEKTMTRRIIRPQPDFSDMQAYLIDEFGTHEINGLDNDGEYQVEHIEPKYKLDETLYLKEPYAADMAITKDGAVVKKKGSVLYRYDTLIGFESCPIKWQNKLFMPEKYARYYIKIIDVRPERLQDISDEDCRKEGIKKHKWDGRMDKYFHIIPSMPYPILNSAREAYAYLIDIISGKGTWESNPYVWVYDFKLTKK
jgi:hypothetical protein